MSSIDSSREVEWRVCAGYPDYEISNYGDLRRLTTWKGAKAGTIKKAMPHPRGYLVYGLGKHDKQLAHRLVVLTFIGPPPTARHEVAHDDGIRTNNWVGNLLWKLPVDNQADRKRHGTYHIGEQCSATKIADKDVPVIRSRYAEGGERYRGGSITMQALATEYGVSIAQISRIVNGLHRLPAP